VSSNIASESVAVALACFAIELNVLTISTLYNCLSLIIFFSDLSPTVSLFPHTKLARRPASWIEQPPTPIFDCIIIVPMSRKYLKRTLKKCFEKVTESKRQKGRKSNGHDDVCEADDFSFRKRMILTMGEAFELSSPYCRRKWNQPRANGSRSDER